MATELTVPALQICTFALGCALIHAARAHAAAVTRFLVGVAAFAAVALLLGASLGVAPDQDPVADEVTAFAAMAPHPFVVASVPGARR